jgi:hypothetical protein
VSIREELELDLTSALASLDTLDASLGRIAIDFKASLLDALEPLTSIAVESVDTSAVTASIDDAVGASDTTIDVEADVAVNADTAPAEADIAALDGQQLSLFTEADVTGAEADIAALDPAPIVVPVEIDTASAQDDLDSLSSSADGAAVGLGTLQGAAQGLDVAAGVAAGSSDSLTSAIAKLSPAAEAGALGIGAIVTTTIALGLQGIRAEGAVQAFNATLGSLAAPIRNLQIGDLNIDLAKLAETLGSDDEAALTAAQRIAQLGIAADASNAQIVEVTQTTVELAANARALNPSLGDLAGITDGLSRALARGGRFLAQYGISLTVEQIKAEAARETGKGLNDQFSQFELRAAGAKLALDQVGPSIEGNITKAGGNAIITLDRIREEFRNAIEDVGSPIIAPLFQSFEAAVPVATNLARVLGQLGSVLLPLGTAVISVITPLTAGLADGVNAALPGLNALIGSLGEVAVAFTPVAEIAGTVFRVFGEGISALTQIPGLLGGIVQPAILLGAALFGIPAAIDAIQVALIFLEANPAIAFFTAIVAVAGAVKIALGGVNDELQVTIINASQVTQQTSALDQGLFNNASTLADLQKAFAGTNEQFGQFIASQSAFAKDATAGTQLRQLAENTGDLRHQLELGGEGLRQFTVNALEAGVVTLNNNQSLEENVHTIRDLASQQDILDLAQKGGIKTGKELIVAFNTQQVALDQLAQTKINQLVLSGQVTQAEVEEAKAFVDARDGGDTYATVLRQIAADVPVAANAATELAAALSTQNQAWLDLGDAIGKATTQNKNIISAQNAVADSAIQVAQAQRAVADLPFQIAAAQRAQRSASLDLADAQRNLRDLDRQYLSDLNSQRSATFGLIDAQRALNDLRRQPQKDANAIASANLDIQSAQLGVVDAQQKLNDLRTDPASNPEEIQKAQIDLARAQLEVSNSTIRLADAQEQASLQGENLSKAQLAVSQAQLQVDQANQQVASHAEAVSRANLAIADANDRVHQSANDATAAIEAQQAAYENLALAVANHDAIIAAAAEAGKLAAESLVTGLTGSLNALVSRVRESGHGIGSVLAQGMREALQEGSPSKVAAEIGAFAVEGLVIGVDQNQADAQASGQALGESLAGGLSDGAQSSVAAAEAIVAQAFAALTQNANLATGINDNTAGLVIAPGSVTPPPSAGVVIQSLTIQVTATPGVTDEEGRAQGQAAAEGFVAALPRAAVRVDVRAS